MKTPVLFLIYNRPELTEKVFERIRQARPSQLFIAGDGAKDAKDQLNVQQARQIVGKVDWDCELKTFFRNENAGCGKAVTQAITWFFEQVTYGIILEDDCLVELSFFAFCEENLLKYIDNEQIMLVSAMSFLQIPHFKSFPVRTTETYYFSQFAQIWGWASWRRAWQKLDFEMNGWEDFIKNDDIKKIILHPKEQKFWLAYLQAYKDQNPNLWATRWWFSVWQARGLAITPYTNLVSNIGFGEGSTNTQSAQSWYANLPTQPIQLPIIHPTHISISHKIDHFTYSVFFNPRENWVKSLKNWLSKYLPLSLRLILKRKKRTP